MLTFRILSGLLRYPDAEVRAALPDMMPAIEAEGLLPASEKAGVASFIAWLRDTAPLDAEATYIEAFDRGRSTSLYVFEHVHGESRDRGQAMVRLMEQYRRHGLEIDSNELPDFLPLFLEFLSTRPFDEACGHLAEVADIVALIAARLRRRGAPHAALLEAVAILADAGIDRAGATAAAAQEDRDDTPEALDKAWEETPVTFDDAGAFDQQGHCPAAGDMVQRFAVPQQDGAAKGG